ncbi:hypothetical protein [Merismopedia glauca]|uniref:Uncharacterized protein n=1 Tax=Merismopedia glauca CCAP 1448/3 TaxID=1296344 RepID=A0A2T1C1W3_9CYAN|nr:hypothetical protein [Merismopedia glauca]PSB02275.1 hypothetical protein C7B64_13920 [Merismopedia glauca CCAP 1448/3]
MIKLNMFTKSALFLSLCLFSQVALNQSVDTSRAIAQEVIPQEEQNIVSNTTKDVTNEVELMGNPGSSKYPSGSRVYARNIWDMQLFNNRLYLGQGNSANSGPAPNAGPAEVWYFDLTSQQFVKQFTTSDEQVSKYRVVGGELMIPGHDPRDSWNLGNLYKLEASGWKKYRNVPNAIHMYDVYKFSNQLFVGLGTRYSQTIYKSTNAGSSWKGIVPNPNPGRIYTLFELGNKLYASGYAMDIVQYNGGFIGVTNNFLLGGTQFKRTTTPPVVVRPTNFQNQLVYIVAKNVNDHQWTPLNLNVAASPTAVRTVTLPGRAKPWDVVCSDSKCYALGAIYNGSGDYTITVSETSNLTEWKEVFRFKSDTFARSFEMDDSGNFYFGLGCEISPIPTSTGNILRVSKSAWSS